MSGAPVLYFAPQTCARVSLTALEEVGEPFETRLIAFMAGEHRQPDYLAVNPSGKVPALVTAGGVVVQTGAILHYLAHAHPQAGLLPQRNEPVGRAEVISWLFRCSSDLHPLVTRFVLPGMASVEADAAVGIRAKAAELLALQLQWIDRELAGREWIFPEGWSIVDAYLAWIWFRLTGAGFKAGPFPAISAHYQRTGERPSAKAALCREEQAQSELTERGLAFRPPPLNQHKAGE